MVERAEDVARLKGAIATAWADGGVPFQRVCESCIATLRVDGASISLLMGERLRETLYASDAVIDKVEELQFTLGEGPCYHAFRTGRPVLVPDLAQASPSDWPVFATAIADQPIGAIFAFPIAIGAIRVGALDLYRREPGPLEDRDLAAALQLVDIAGMALLRVRGAVLGSETDPTWPDVGGRWEVHQATGMVKVQLGVDIEEAFARLRAHAFATDRLVVEVARDVVSGRLRMDAEDPP